MPDTLDSSQAEAPAMGSETFKRAVLLIAVFASCLTPFMEFSINMSIPATFVGSIIVGIFASSRGER